MDNLQGCACGGIQNLTLGNRGTQENPAADSFLHILLLWELGQAFAVVGDGTCGLYQPSADLYRPQENGMPERFSSAAKGSPQE